MTWFVRDIWHKYHSWYFKIVANFTRLTAHEITYNNFEKSLVVFMPNITTNHTINCSKKGHFEDIFDRKVALLDYKSIDIKKLQNLRCRKSPWLVHGFYLVKTLKFLYPEFFWQNFRKKCLGDILDRKIAFLHYKNIQDFGQTWKFSFFSF